MRRRSFLTYINLGDAPSNPEFSVVIVIDDSGSMSGEPLQAVRQAFRHFVNTAPEGTKIGLIGFGTDIKVYAEPTEYRDFLLDQVNRFQGESGSTNLYDAIGAACDLFVDKERHRYILVLTDGGDTGSNRFDLQKPSEGKENLIDYVSSKQASVLAVGYQQTDYANLQLIAEHTGGCYFSADEATDLVNVFEAALKAIIEDRNKIHLRSELTRLMKQSSVQTSEGDMTWLNHLSLDEWQEEFVRYDGTHIQFPCPHFADTKSYKSLFSEKLCLEDDSILEKLWYKQISQNKPSPMGNDFFIVGWLDDPAFRVLSCKLVQSFINIKNKYHMYLPGNLNIIFVPLIYELGGLKEDELKDCYAWVTAARNCWSESGPGWDTMPLAILPISQGSIHQRLNPSGISGMDRNGVVCCAAEILKCLMLEPPRLDKITMHPERPIHALGAASVEANIWNSFQQSLLSCMKQSVESFRTAPSNIHNLNNQTIEIIKNDRLGLKEVKNSLLAPLIGSDGGVLAAVQLDVSKFFPPTYMAEDDYFETLPWAVKERGSEYLYRKTEVLRRVIEQRAAEKAADICRKLTIKVDEMLFEQISGGLQAAFDLLDTFRNRLKEERDSIEIGDVSAELEKIKLFSEDENAVANTGMIDTETAWTNLLNAILNRPQREAIFLRHGVLALLLGGFTEGLCSLLFPNLLSFIGGGVVASIVVAVGVVRWLHSRQRINTALQDYCAALVRRARRQAEDLCIQEIKSLYERIINWIGDARNVPEPGVDGCHESQLTEIQRIQAFDNHLEKMVETSLRRYKENLHPANRFVFELGNIYVAPNSAVQKLDLTSKLFAGQTPINWTDIASKDENKNWRQVCRRKNFDNLQNYIEYHYERLELPRRILQRLEKQLSGTLIGKNPIGSLLPSISQIRELEEVLESSSFPCVMLDSNICIISPPTEYLMNKDNHELLRAGGINWPLPSYNLDNSWEVHALRDIKLSMNQIQEFAEILNIWSKCDQSVKRAALSNWGNPDTLFDPNEGNLCLIQTSNNALADGEEI